ncbi:4Fe-4S dicluster domain-containing protein [Desulfuribacillus alkaliarsenatis]|uniref:Formate dehydrogenase n=1 Tax=Desulfuribacillus alkaliarsenatis TaxID=766136 RepID=A0A1E5FZC8_9FIRM|nr:4Fe-4S dicluster domain-containing protein [Desulfuribacillus alkaliarsenatis]OEF95921.1 formate dehydrogenase [Desulfuribacillus alkaliarsenatis]
MEITMFHDVSKCTACRACSVACKQWKDLPAEITPFTGEYQSHTDLSPKTYNVLRMSERMEGSVFHWDFLKFQCMHCGDAACVKACPKEALTKSSNGVISLNEDKCVGCGYCAQYCPFGVPKIDEGAEKTTKCNLCEDRIAQGMTPSCAQTCTADAIYYGLKENMIAMAEARVQELRKTNPNAQTYGINETGVGGTHMIYVLETSPENYGLPVNPVVPTSLSVMKDIVQPLGKVALGGALAAVLTSFVLTRGKDPHHDHDIAEDGKKGVDV